MDTFESYGGSYGTGYPGTGSFTGTGYSGTGYSGTGSYPPS